MAAPEWVWYAAYGSNLWLARFRCYFEGGTPPGHAAAHAPCSDPAPPRDDRPYTLRHSLYFARNATGWGGGGCAFIDARPAPGVATKGRIYLISSVQFEHLFRAENDDPDAAVPWDAVAAGQPEVIGGGWYGLVLPLAEIECHPVLTFTSPEAAPHAPVQPPSPAYARAIAAGLRETYGLDDAGITAYLARCPGLAGTVSPETLRLWLTTELA